jgi:hypothetical protein
MRTPDRRWRRALCDAQQGLALLWRRTPVDNVPAFAFAFMDGAGPTEDAGRAQTVEPRRAVKALLDVEYRQPAAMPVRRQRVELAGAAIVAIAVAEFPPLDLPRDHLSTSLIEPPGTAILEEAGAIMAEQRASKREPADKRCVPPVGVTHL